MNSSNNKTIAKNTFLLYFRMMFIMLITLYTSRIVLKILGIDDFGIYQVAGGVVTLFSFINGALSVSSSRFLTYELGTGDFNKLKRTFNTTLSIHILLALFILLFSETIGLWFVYNKLGIAENRLAAALWVYHLSVFTAVINITQVPYTAVIVSHEKFSIYAYISIFEAVAKLLIVYLLAISNIDKLKLYASLICILQITIALFYRFYCSKKYKETLFKFVIDKTILKEIGGFSFWSLFANLSIALNSHGTTIITNIFFNPAIVAARAISVQVNMAVNQFVNNFRTAVNPQIVKKYAIGDIAGSKDLLLNSTKYSFYIMFLLSIPVIFHADFLLSLWLGQIPEYGVPFLQLIMIQSLFSVFNTSFYTALYAKGRMKENALLTPLIGFIRFPIVYFLFKIGYSPLVLSYAGIVSYAFLGLIVKPILICKIVDYTYKDILKVFIPCAKVVFLSMSLSSIVFFYLNDTWYEKILSIIIFLIISSFTICITGIDKKLRSKIFVFINKKLRI